MAKSEQDELDALRQRVAELEKEAGADTDPPKTVLGRLFGWLDLSFLENMIKLIGIPAALVGAVTLFWDDVWLAWQGRNSEAVEKVAANIVELQKLDETNYVFEAAGDSAKATASEVANTARRERLVAETYDHWVDNPDYFRPAELQILTHYLILQSRTDDALHVFERYAATLEGPFQTAAGLLLEARIYAHPGPVQDLDVARQKIRDGFALTEDIASEGDRVPMQAQLVYLRGIIELDRAEDCAAAEPFVSVLEELATTDRTGLAAQPASELRARYEMGCA